MVRFLRLIGDAVGDIIAFITIGFKSMFPEINNLVVDQTILSTLHSFVKKQNMCLSVNLSFCLFLNFSNIAKPIKLEF